MPECTRIGSVIVARARTPIGRLLGGSEDLSAADLSGVAIKGALERAGVKGDQVDYVILGQVIQAGADQNPARLAAIIDGIPVSVPSMTINEVCFVWHQRYRPSGISSVAPARPMSFVARAWSP